MVQHGHFESEVATQEAMEAPSVAVPGRTLNRMVQVGPTPDGAAVQDRLGPV